MDDLPVIHLSERDAKLFNDALRRSARVIVVDRVDIQLFRDVTDFLQSLPPDIPKAHLTVTHSCDEASMQWGDHTTSKRAIVTFEGDGGYGYAMLRDGQFEPGEAEGLPCSAFPPDLASYLQYWDV